MVRGGVRFWWPLWKILTSVPQVEQLRTLSLTSSGPHVGLGHVLEPDVLGGVEAQCLHGGWSFRGGGRGRLLVTRSAASQAKDHINGQEFLPECLATCPIVCRLARIEAVTGVTPQSHHERNPDGLDHHRRSPARGARVHVQKFGTFLSNMIMPNIGAIIAWGLITAFFIPVGWTPNEKIATIVGPTIFYLLPILIAYTGGKIVYGARGGVVGGVVGDRRHHGDQRPAVRRRRGRLADVPGRDDHGPARRRT